jgi:hypothetical protein
VVRGRDIETAPALVPEMEAALEAA